MKAITANRFEDGRVVYLGTDDQWKTDVYDAIKFADLDVANKKLLTVSQRQKEIADIYIIDIDETGLPSGRARIQERIRSAGPTVRQDLGYQASQ